MADQDEVREWLSELPLDEVVEVDSESVYLNTQPGGAELGVYLAQDYTGMQLDTALKLGFSSAVHHRAGLGLSSDGRTLVLNRWLPQAGNWNDASAALEELLNQAADMRAAMSPQKPNAAPTERANRTEERLRRLLAGAGR